MGVFSRRSVGEASVEEVWLLFSGIFCTMIVPTVQLHHFTPSCFPQMLITTILLSTHVQSPSSESSYEQDNSICISFQVADTGHPNLEEDSFNLVNRIRGLST